MQPHQHWPLLLRWHSLPAFPSSPQLSPCLLIYSHLYPPMIWRHSSLIFNKNIRKPREDVTIVILHELLLSLVFFEQKQNIICRSCDKNPCVLFIALWYLVLSKRSLYPIKILSWCCYVFRKYLTKLVTSCSFKAQIQGEIYQVTYLNIAYPFPINLGLINFQHYFHSFKGCLWKCTLNIEARKRNKSSHLRRYKTMNKIHDGKFKTTHSRN